MEWKLPRPKKWRALLGKLGIKPTIRKTKKSKMFQLGEFTIELNKIRLLGYFLEIETIAKSDKEVSTAKNKLVKLFKNLGYNQSQFEKRPYLELLDLYPSE